ncbi:MAG: hypothetical protein GX814_06215 [Microbacteriaceae bacterium]|nr:hypothetical protein [Microbacteriaceae bacterium]
MSLVHTAPDQIFALVRPFGSNVLQIHAWPETSLVDVVVALRRQGLEARPTGIDANGQPNALLTFSEHDYSENDLARFVDALNSAGVAAYGYTLVHDHEFIDVDLFRRLGSVPPPHADAPIFMNVLQLDDIDERGSIFAFGDAHKLSLLAERAAAHVDSVDPVEGMKGVDSVHLSFGYDFLVRTGALVDALNEAGIEVHLRVTRAVQ